MDLHLLLFGCTAPSLLCSAYAALVRYSRETLPWLIQGNAGLLEINDSTEANS